MQEMLSAVQLDSYGMHDLDPEWRVLLESLDARLEVQRDGGRCRNEMRQGAWDWASRFRGSWSHGQRKP